MDFSRAWRATWTWAIGNLLWNGVMAAWAFGGSAVITAVAGAALAGFAGMATPFLILLLVGIFLLGLVGMGKLGQRLKIGQPQPEAKTPPVVPAKETRLAPFDPDRLMFSKIMRADFTGLWSAQHDHYVDFIVYVKQTSDCEVTLTDVQGRIRIGTDECSLPARLVNSPRKLTDSRSFYDCTVRQPLSQEMASALAVNPGPLNLWDADAKVRVSLAGLKWIGTIALPQGTSALPDRVVCEEEFVILGPVREGDSDMLLIRGGTFLSSQVWRHHDSGALREQGGASGSGR